MTGQVIPAEAVEAAAKGAYSVGKIDAGVDWENLHPARREVYVEMARAALEAAAPNMQCGCKHKTTILRLNDPNAKWEAL